LSLFETQKEHNKNYSGCLKAKYGEAQARETERSFLPAVMSSTTPYSLLFSLYFPCPLPVEARTAETGVFILCKNNHLSV
jgi:hypothetical protein